MSDDTLQVDCGEHGKRNAAIVCRHLLNEKHKALGFVENSAEPGDYQGWCYDCESLFLEEDDMTEKFKEFTNAAVVCEECYTKIKSIHVKEP